MGQLAGEVQQLQHRLRLAVQRIDLGDRSQHSARFALPIGRQQGLTERQRHLVLLGVHCGQLLQERDNLSALAFCQQLRGLPQCSIELALEPLGETLTDLRLGQRPLEAVHDPPLVDHPHIGNR